jgi:hypothetical protein
MMSGLEATRTRPKAVLGVTMALLAEPTVGFAEFHNYSEGNDHE